MRFRAPTAALLTLALCRAAWPGPLEQFTVLYSADIRGEVTPCG